MKRAFDFLVSITSIALGAPVIVGLILIIKCSDTGPVLFRQKRVGRYCQEFTIYKFRTMVVDAERRGGHATMENDPRITRIGRILRKTSMDELPQLFNVVCGDMSIVGPRPDVPAQQSEYSPEDWKLRHSVRPGITGLAQSTSRSS
ncbi:MAG: sugar transferase, partial [Sphingorhabdus sp.]